MSDMNRSFAGSMPEFYDRIIVPVTFEPFARELAERLKGMNSGRVLEIAAGTGVVTRALAHTLPAAVEITATDLNPAMLDQAKSHPGMERVRWREADALALPFDERLFDCVICQFGVMFFPDKQAGFREALRVLRPESRFLFSVWGDRADTAFDVVAEIVGEFLFRDPVSLGAPLYNDVAAVTAELAAAGFGPIAAQRITKLVHSSSAREVVVSRCHGGLIRAAIEAMAPARLDEITDAATAAIAARFGGGAIEVPLHAILFTAVRPVD